MSRPHTIDESGPTMNIKHGQKQKENSQPSEGPHLPVSNEKIQHHDSDSDSDADSDSDYSSNSSSISGCDYSSDSSAKSIASASSSLCLNDTSCSSLSGSCHSPCTYQSSPMHYDVDATSASEAEAEGSSLSLSLIDRSNLIQSIIRLSRHVPGCVLDVLVDAILRSDRYDHDQSRDEKITTTTTTTRGLSLRRRKGNNRKHSKSRSRRLIDGNSCETCQQGEAQVPTERRKGYKYSTKNTSNRKHHSKSRSRRGLVKVDSSCEICQEGKAQVPTQTQTQQQQHSSTSNDKNIDMSASQHQHQHQHQHQSAISNLPMSEKRESAILFVDISGFTKISTMLDVDSFSNCINSYFQKIINQVAFYGGDILKFAGDAIFCEWRVEVSHDSDDHNDGSGSRSCCQTLDQCVLQAATCASAIVATCSDFNLIGKSGMARRRSSRLSSVSSFSSLKERSSSFASASSTRRDSITECECECSDDDNDNTTTAATTTTRPALRRRASFKRRVSVEAPFNRCPSVESTLNIKCGLGAGRVAGIHVGDDTIISRREYLVLGDPIDQVAMAEAAASHGEVFASPEAIACLAKVATIEKVGECKWESDGVNENERRPTRIAVRRQQFFQSKDEYNTASSQEVRLPLFDGESLLQRCEDFDSLELQWLQRMISLYVHPVVVNDENESFSQMKKHNGFDHHYDRNTMIAAPELRNVYTCFISPMIDCNLTGDGETDQKLFNQLNDIMTTTTRHLDRSQGQLRQFIVDDKGVVLIFTFGLRGSTFPNMIAQRAIPVTFSICQSLQEELGIKVTAGVTFDKAYCGVVGGLNRHEFAVLGPSVNLAARLMSSKHNSGVILVDTNVRLLTSQIFFKPLPAVRAKGYADLVPIFQLVKTSEQTDHKWGHAKKRFVGRGKEIKQIMHVAKDMALAGTTSKFLFVSAASGMGKSTLLVQATESVRAMAEKMKKRIIVTRNISNEGDSRIPFSVFRSIFKDLLRQIKDDNEDASTSSTSSMSSMKGSKSKQSSDDKPADFEIDTEWDSLSLPSHSSKSSMMSTDSARFRFICEELNASPEIGKIFLGLRSSGPCLTEAKPLDLQTIVNFMADAFLHCTKHADLVLLALDDVQWMDEMSWKVVQAIFERSLNVLTFCGSRPLSTNPLAVNEDFWSELQGLYRESDRYWEISLGPFSESEVQEMIVNHLNIDSMKDIDGNFWRNVLTTSSGMPHYLSYVLETIDRNDLTIKLDNGLIGLKSSEGDENKLGFTSVNELLLYRLDTLDAPVRTALHLAAVLGTKFDLLDAALAYEEVFGVNAGGRFQSAMDMLMYFDVAEKEGILEQVFASAEQDYDEFGDPIDEIDNSLEDLAISSTGRKSHPLSSDNRRYRFTHDSWKTSILNIMLDGRKEEMHEQVAVVLEREIGDEAQSRDDLEMQIRVFKHWNLSGNFPKAADLALNIGGQLMILGLNTQADLLFSDVIMGLTTNQGGKTYGGVASSVLDALDPPELEYLIKLYIAKGKALCNLAQGKAGAEAYQGAIDILEYAPCAGSKEFDRSVSFPIFSGLFVVLKMGVIQQSKDGSYEKSLCRQFVEQARLNEDPVHYGRALAMEGETLARLGNFEEALERLEVIKSIYDIKAQHVAICRAYGSDRVGQAFSHSVNWNHVLGRTEAAMATCEYIVRELAPPKSDIKNAHNTFCLLYSVIVSMKEQGMALEARDLFLTKIVTPFEEHFGSGGSTFTKPMWKPILMVLDLQGNEDKEIDLDEYVAWALDDSNYSLKSVIEGAMGNYSATPLAMFGEVPYHLAKREEIELEKRKCLIRTATTQMKRSLENSEKCIPYAKVYAQEKLDAIKLLARKLNCIDS